MCFREGTGATERTGRLVEPWDRASLPDLAPKGDAGPRATEQTPAGTRLSVAEQHTNLHTLTRGVLHFEKGQGEWEETWNSKPR